MSSGSASRTTIYVALATACVCAVFLLHSWGGSEFDPAEAPVAGEAMPVEVGGAGAGARLSGGAEPAEPDNTRNPADAPPVSTIANTVRASWEALTAASAWAHASRLPLDDPDRADIAVEIHSLCRPRVSLDAQFESLVKHGILPPGEDSKRLFLGWVTAREQFCGGFDVAQLDKQQGYQLLRDVVSVESSAAQMLALDYIGNAAERTEMLRSPEVQDNLWAMLRETNSRRVAETAVLYLSEAGVGPFDWARDALLEPGVHGSLDKQRAAMTSTAAHVFICRSFGGCGPGTARHLELRWYTERGRLGGVEGSFRENFTDYQWEMIERIARELEARRMGRPPDGRGG